MAGFEDYETYDGLGLAELVRAKEVAPTDLLEAAIARVERHNPALNAVVHEMYDAARRAIADGLPEGPFTGVPFLLKDLGALTSGTPTTNGSRLFADYVADHDTTLTERVRAAGLVIMGKTNTPEMGVSAACEPVLHGAARNPWNPERSPGGSSGGAAAAVAARLVPMAHGSDGGGSIRIPAANCGLFGLKPTRARNPAGPDVGEGWSGLATIHAVTRSVRDSAALLDATSGPAPGDPYWAPPPARPFLDEIGADPGRLHIAFTTTAPTGVPVHPECVKAAAEAARLCAGLGHGVTEAAPELDMELAIRTMRTIWAANLWAAVETRYQALGREADGDGLETITWLLAQEGRTQSAADYARALPVIHGIGRGFARFFEDYDLLLTPTLAQPPWPLGTIDMMGRDLEAYFDTLYAHMPFTAQFNASGQPAVSVPLHWTGDGLPVGVQFVARFGDEATLLRLSAQLEAAQPWADRRPPL
ncbi:MAG: amidase [Proteobacteria bacterium]|nr:amidase [Pseudomonadota bacterium]